MVEFDIIFGKGIFNVGCIIDLVEEMDVIKCRGVWYSYKGSNFV